MQFTSSLETRDLRHTDNLSCFVVVGSTGFGATFYSFTVKVKVTLEEVTKTHKKVEIKFYSFFSLAAIRVLLVNGTLRPLYPQQSSGIHCIVGRVGHRDDLEGYGKFLPSREFDPRTVQPVASRYTV